MENNSFHLNQDSPLFIGQNYTYLPETHSTNLRLKILTGSEKLPEGTVISAGYQTEGRGQAGAVWESGRDQNMMLSVLLYPKFLSVTDQFLLSKAMALAVLDFILNFLPDKPVKIKWPNDILVSGRKICGILIENGLKGERIEYSIIGMGININQLFNNHLRTSLKELTGIDYARQDCERILFSCIVARYLQLRIHEEDISKKYLEALYGYGEKMHFKDNVKNEDFYGIITGISQGGKLMIETEGNERLFDMKEVGFAVNN